MNEVINKENIKIESLIYEIRGKQVMLDRDLAKLYNVTTKVFMQSIKRNIKRFPPQFMFQLTNEEFMIWRSQFVTSNNDKIGLRRPPYAFTEQGIAMISGILNSEIAINTSIQIINAFVAMRHYIGSNEYRISNIETKIIEHDSEIKLLQETFNKLDETRKINEIYFNGQIYDAYSKIKDIIMEAKDNLVIIDSYIDKSILDMIKDINTKVLIITKSNSKLTSTDITKYNSQYNNLKVKYDNTYHDRYIIIDKKKIYHLGASINHAGNRTFSINILEDDFVINSLLNKINI